MKQFLHRVYLALSSMRLTMVCLSAAMILVFAGTLAQVQLGIQIVQERYFQSIFVWWPFGQEDGFRIPVFPGGHLIGGVLLVNLVLAHIRHFAWTWRALGIQLTHAGLIIMLAGGALTDIFSVESHMRLEEGETKNYSEEYNARELAVTNTSGPELDQVTAISADGLRKGSLISHESLPFSIAVKEFYPNSRVTTFRPSHEGTRPASTHGVGSSVTVSKQPLNTEPDKGNMMSAVIEILPGPDAQTDGRTTLGTWLVSDGLATTQVFEAAGKTWSIALRPKRHYKPFSLTLLDFVHERYPGTQIPKNFSSRVILHDPAKSTDREALIYMNHPLRYQAETFYQSGFDRNEDATILQVVATPSFEIPFLPSAVLRVSHLPYISCVVVGAGLLLQFSMHLVGFSRRNKKTSHA